MTATSALPPGPNGPLFISHASADDGFVKELRDALEAHRLPVWVDSRNLRGGTVLNREIELAIESARHVIVVLSRDTVNSRWVRREIEKALAVEQRRRAEGYRVIPLLLPGLTTDALDNWFEDEPLAVPVQLGPGGLNDALPTLLAALERRLPTDPEPAAQPAPKPLEELILALADPSFDTHEGKRRVTATATLIYEPAHPTARRIESKRFTFTAPLGPIEADDLRWYLEQYFLWPVGVFKTRAEGIEKKLPQWGQDLFQAALGTALANEPLAAWQHAAEGAEPRFSVQVDSDLPEGAPAEAQATAREAATELLGLPWELLHDDHTWLFQGKRPVRVRRRLPNRQAQPPRPTALPIRILLVSPRPEHDGKGHGVGYLDHRISARPLVEAVEQLGELVKLTILAPPTYAALDEALQQAAEREEPFDVVHFDGHGVYDKRLGLGGLCFEEAHDADKLEQRTMEFIDASRLAGLFKQHRVPLVFLEACQTAVSELDPTASVAARLLEEGVTSVVAMSHSVLVETARRFVQAFYGELARGARVGRAMLAGQRALHDDTSRGKIMGAGDLRLHDWFVPVIYQEEHDPQLITKIPSKDVQLLEARKRRLNLGALPEEPSHGFQGRGRDLLALERLLHRQPWAVVRGTGGQGKTTLAAELARWLTRTARFDRAVFVSLEKHRDARAALDAIGHQLLGQNNYSVAAHRDLDEAFQPIERALRDHATILVLDNCESVMVCRSRCEKEGPSELPPGFGVRQSSAALESATNGKRQRTAALQDAVAPERAPVEVVTSAAKVNADDTLTAILSLCRQLLAADPRTRLVFTTREPLPTPFDARGRERELGALDRADAIELVSQVMAREGLVPESSDPGRTPQEIVELVEAVHCHARALVLLAREVARRGVKATTDNLRALMADLERKHPGDRENSLYASVELSLRRLSPASRQHIRVLAVCQGGVKLTVLAMLTGLDEDGVRQLAIELIEVGLGEDMGGGHLRLDPALPPYLLGELSAAEADATRARWAEAMAQLTGYLGRESGKNAQLAAHLTRLELPNLLAMLEFVSAAIAIRSVAADVSPRILSPSAGSAPTNLPAPSAARQAGVGGYEGHGKGAAIAWPPERVVDLAQRVEALTANLGQPQALAVATRVRERAARLLGDWSHARFVTESATIHRLLERGDLPAALKAAQRLLHTCRAASQTAYPEAAYDLATAYLNLGRALQRSGAAEAALGPLAEAQRRFQHLGDAGDAHAERMAAAAIGETGSCLRDLGRLDDAAAAYQDTIERMEKLHDRRSVAAAKFQFGTVWMLQQRYAEALDTYAEARDTFAAFNEPCQVATAWHHIGMVHEKAGQFEPAEQAHRQALAIRVRENDLAGQASSLGELGVLCFSMGRLEDAVTFQRQAADVYVRLRKLAGEGRQRSNLAVVLINLRRYDEARRELARAIECKQPYGHAAEPWKTWSILEELERATGQVAAAQAARQQALETYLAYRRAGGVSQSPAAQLFELVAQAIQQSQPREASETLSQFAASPQASPDLKALIAKLHFILAGDRNPALAADLALDYADAAELHLLLEQSSARATRHDEGNDAA